jgi:hypothetical protein
MFARPPPGLANDQNEAIAEKVDSNLVWLPYRQNLTAFLLADNQAGHPNVSFASRKVSNYLRELCGHQLSQTLP